MIAQRPRRVLVTDVRPAAAPGAEIEPFEDVLWLEPYRDDPPCGAIRFECDLDLAAGTTRCNCSICKKARFWMAFAKTGAFPPDHRRRAALGLPAHAARQAHPFLHFHFCSRCGVRAFTASAGPIPEMGGSFHASNLACLDDATDAELAAAPIHYPDGRADDWKATPAIHSYL